MVIFNCNLVAWLIMSLIILRIIRVLTNVLNRAELQVNKSINIGNVARWRSQLAKKSRYVV